MLGVRSASHGALDGALESRESKRRSHHTRRAPSTGTLDWQPERGTRVHVLERSSGKVTTHTMHPAFFFFHVASMPSRD